MGAFTTIVYAMTVNGASHTVQTMLDGGTEYFWRVSAVNPCGPGTPSTPFSFTTEGQMPNPRVFMPAIFK